MGRYEESIDQQLNERLSALQKRQDAVTESVAERINERHAFLANERIAPKRESKKREEGVVVRPAKTPRFDVTPSKLIELDAYMDEQEFSVIEKRRIIKRFEIRSGVDERIIVQGERFYVDPGRFDYADLMEV